ncbi:MAG TPA: hypothetical protein VIX82_03735 [Solirubrobacteraceae bacterium]
MLWTLTPLIAFAAERAQHVGLEALLTFAVGFGPLLVVVASFVDPRAYWKLIGALAEIGRRTSDPLARYGGYCLSRCRGRSLPDFRGSADRASRRR